MCKSLDSCPYCSRHARLDEPADYRRLAPLQHKRVTITHLHVASGHDSSPSQVLHPATSSRTAVELLSKPRCYGGASYIGSTEMLDVVD